MIAATATAQDAQAPTQAKATEEAKAAAFSRLAKIKDELTARLSLGAYTSRAQSDWAALPDYMKDLVGIMAGLDEYRTNLDWMAYTASEKIAIQNAARVLRHDVRGLQSLAIEVLA